MIPQGKLPAAGLACLSATSKRFGLEDGEAGCSLSESAALLRIRNECVRDASAYESLRGCESFKRLLRTLELPVRILPTGLTPYAGTFYPIHPYRSLLFLRHSPYALSPFPFGCGGVEALRIAFLLPFW